MIELIEKMLQGELQSLSRLISLVEKDVPEVPEIIKEIHPYLGNAHVVEVTGPPGCGKSTLVDRLTVMVRSRGLTVGIMAFDPTSPLTGGALLGDRIRMQQHYLDAGVFIRSMATRGSRGGFPPASLSVIKLLDAFGSDLIFLETVGVGQIELKGTEVADSIIVVLVPEAGDTIQMMKAGPVEIANIVVVNKTDHQGADRLIMELKSIIRSSLKISQWESPVIGTQAVNDIGIEELYKALERHREHLQKSGELVFRRQQQRREEFLQKVEQRLHSRLYQLLWKDDKVLSLVKQVESGEMDPYTAADIIEMEALPRDWLLK